MTITTIVTESGAVDHVRVRGVREGDHALVGAVYEGLSARSRLLRFHGPVPRIPDRYIAQLARVAVGERCGVLALAGDRPIGHGQWVRDHADPATAELALAVVDDWHGRGAGLAMCADLAAAAQRAGIRDFTCLVLGENRVVRRVLSRIGARPRPGAYDEFLLPVDVLATSLVTETPARLPRTAVA
ncbi:MAG: GNAT family N-acetyltransferase [Dermatophilaceae bacterium]